jgi:hypothetical protein
VAEHRPPFTNRSVWHAKLGYTWGEWHGSAIKHAWLRDKHDRDFQQTTTHKFWAITEWHITEQASCIRGCMVLEKGRYSSVGIATCYGLDVRGSNPSWGEIFRIRPDRSWGSMSILYNGYGVFRGGKMAGAWRWPPTLASAEVKERIELYLNSTSWPSWPVIGWTLNLMFLEKQDLI